MDIEGYNKIREMIIGDGVLSPKPTTEMPHVEFLQLDYPTGGVSPSAALCALSGVIAPEGAQLIEPEEPHIDRPPLLKILDIVGGEPYFPLNSVSYATFSVRLRDMHYPDPSVQQ